MRSKFWALLLSIMMVVTMMPASAFADTDTGTQYDIYLYTLVPGKTLESSGKPDEIWNGMGIGKISGVNAPSSYLHGQISEDGCTYTDPTTNPVYPNITVDGISYQYAAPGSGYENTQKYYTVTWIRTVVAAGANAGKNEYNSPTIDSGIKTFHRDGYVTLNESNYYTVSYMVKNPGESDFTTFDFENYTQRVAENTDTSSLYNPVSKKVTGAQELELYKIIDGITYVFDGWYTDARCTTKAVFNDDTKITANTNYYGRYVAAELTATGGTWTYDGTSHAATASVTGETDYTVQYKVGNGKWTTTAPSVTNVSDGKVTVSVRAVRDGYPTLTTSNVTLEITKRPVEFIGETATKVYNKSEQEITGITYTTTEGAEDGIVKGQNWSGLTYSAKGTNAGEYPGEFSGTVVIKDADRNDVTDNYAVSTEPGKLTINPNTDKLVVTVTGNNATYTYDGTEKSVSGFRTDAPAGVEVKLNDGKKAEAKGTDADTYQMGLKAEDFTATSTNYSNIKIQVTDGYLKIDPADSLTVNIKGDTLTDTYDGEEKSVSGFTTDAPAGVTVSLTEDSADKASITKTDAGTYQMGLTAGDFTAASGNYKKVVIGTVTDGQLVINPRAVTLTSESESKTYDGSALTKPDVTVTGDGFVEGEVSKITATGSVTHVSEGEVTNSIAITPNSTYKESNYVITKEEGKLWINPVTDVVTVKITGHNAEFLYNGTEKSVSGYDVDIVNKLYTQSNIKFEGSASASGTDVKEGGYAMGLTEENFSNTSADFTNVTFEVTDGKLTITPRNVTLTSKSATKQYDGKPLTSPEVTVIGDGFVAGEVSNITATGSVTNVSEEGVTNTITFTKGEKYKDENYNITKDEGTLIVTDRETKYEITVVANSETVTYDGNEQSVSGLKATEFTVEGNRYTVEGLTASASGTDAGTYTSEITGTAVVRAADGTDVTDQFTVNKTNGQLVINPRAVTLTSESGSKTYDGSALTKPDVTVTGDGFVEGEVSKITATGSVTNVSEGKVTNTITFEKGAAFKDKNYRIEEKPGTLKITAIQEEVTVNIKGNSGEYTYDGTVKTVSGYTVTSISNDLYKNTYFDFSGTASVSGTDADNYPMKLSEDDFANINTNFEKVTFVVEDGLLTINPVESVVVTITGNSDEVTYNGAAHKVEGYSVQINNELYTENDFSFSGTAVAEGTNAATYKMGLGVDDFANTNPNFKDVEFEVTDGQLVINRKPVTVAAINNTKVYGTEDPELEALVTGLVGDDKVEYTITRKSGEDVGTYTITAAGAEIQGNYAVTYGTAVFTITPVTDKVIVTITENSGSDKYDGTEKTVEGYKVTSITNSLYTANDFEFTGEDADKEIKATDAGTYNMNLKAADFANISENFTNVEFVIVDGTLTIAKRSVLMTSATASKTFDGDPLTAESVEVTGDGFVEGEGAEYSNFATIIKFGSIENTFDYTLKDGTKADNYAIEKVYGTLTIAKKGEVVVTITENSDRVTYDGEEHEVTGYDVSISDPLYTEEDFEFSGTASAKGTDAGTYDMQLKPEDFQNTNDDFENVTFNIVDGALVIDPLDAVAVTITENSDTVIYDGEAHEVTGYTVKTSSQLYTEDDFTFSGTAVAKGTDAGTYDMNVKAEDFANTNSNFTNVRFTVVDGSLTINKRLVTLTSETASKPYDGTALERPDVTVTGDGFVKGEVSDIKATGSVTNADSVVNTITYTEETGFKADNYTIIKNEGTLTITPYTNEIIVTVTENSDKVKYDGESHKVTGYEIASISNSLYTKDDFEFTGKAEASGVDAGTYDIEVTSSDFRNTSPNFNNVKFVVNDGTLEIEKRDVVMTSATASKTFDGDPLTAESVEVTGDGFAEGEGATYSNFASITRAGSIENTFDYTLNGSEDLRRSATADEIVTNPDNYNIQQVYGTLTVAKKGEVVVTITENSDRVTYDGEEHEVTGYDVSISDPLYTEEDFRFTGKDEITGTDVGTYDMELTAEDFENINDDFENVTFNIVDGTLVIDPIDTVVVTITEHGDEVIYDGKEHEVTGYDVSINNDLYTEDDFEFNGNDYVSGTEVGTYDMLLTAADFTNTNENFTDVQFVIVDGQLIINADNGGVKTGDNMNIMLLAGTALTALLLALALLFTRRRRNA